MKKTVTMTINGASHSPRGRAAAAARALHPRAGRPDRHARRAATRASAAPARSISNGQAVKSCTLLAVQADGAQITTIEGLAKDGKLHPIQEGFWEKHGLQCGFCTPGHDHVGRTRCSQRNPKPTEDADPPRARGQPLPLHRLSQHRQGHPVRRREDGGEVGRRDHGHRTSCSARASSGARIPRFITGKGNYTDDLKLPGMTYAAFVRSPHAHAKIRKIDTAKAPQASGRRGGLHRQGHDRA